MSIRGPKRLQAHREREMGPSEPLPSSLRAAEMEGRQQATGGCWQVVTDRVFASLGEVAFRVKDKVGEAREKSRSLSTGSSIHTRAALL